MTILGKSCLVRAARIYALLAVALFIAGHILAQDSGADTNAIPKLRPPRDEIPSTFLEQHSVSVSVSAIVFLAVAGVAIWYLRRSVPVTPLAPAVAARQALEPLRQKTEDGLLLSNVSQVVRHYIGAAILLESAELTTAEFCHAISRHAQIGSELASELAAFLRRCDQRKFPPKASGPPLDAVSTALRFIDLGEARLAAQRQAPPVIDPSPIRAATSP